ncbi:SPOR domain-containing protein [Algoriphagus confluentis]|uniref:SPOR domain-containing protein n=1 Tax=Algoriphagus confluentis TaxID=1697556 RepID=A0ABQ6PKH8_9BACT|nr:hypothetical protein Aconfl_11270 [Algoriphagus confluentis]
MNTKGSDKKQWTDPKDFGLPWVEIKPLQANPKKNRKPVESFSAEAIQNPVQAEIEKPISSVSTEKKESKKVAESFSKASPSTPVQDKKKGTPTWAWLVFVLFAAIFAVLVWQILLQTRQTDSPVTTNSSSVQEVKDTPSTEQMQPEITSNESIQPADNEVAKVEEVQVSENNPPAAQSGTTIAQNISGNLIRIESQAERPQYFIIVGSVPSEADALKLIPDFQGKSSEVYLISPYTESKNYRVAIGKFTSFRAAAEKLDEIKSQYSEELWILKY